MIDVEKMKSSALEVSGWGNCNSAWLDTSEDESAAVVGHIDEDGITYPVVVVDCDQYYAGQDSLPLAKFYARSNPRAVLELIKRLEDAEKQRDGFHKMLLSEPDTKGALFKAENILREAIAEAKGNTNLNTN